MRGPSPSSRSYRRPLAAAGVFVLFAGMLFWTKLRLVSDIPRTAYAVPKEQQPEADAEAVATETVEDDERDQTPDDDNDQD